MFQVLIQRDLLGQLILAAVDHHADIAAAFCLFEHLFVSSLAAAHNRREKLDFRPLRECHDLIDHLVHRLIDRSSRRQAFDAVDIRFFHLS